MSPVEEGDFLSCTSENQYEEFTRLFWRVHNRAKVEARLADVDRRFGARDSDRARVYIQLGPP